MKHEHEHTQPPSDPALRIKALESLLIEKGLVDPGAIDELVDIFEHRIGPRNGARVVARAWVDPLYRQRLLEDGTKAMANTPQVHNVVVCTLCSCYPWPTLGLPPTWYKSPPYRSRVVIEPRKVLAEFGLAIAPEVEVRVWDSSAEIRYLVLPMRPDGTEGWTEEQLAALVTRDSMIGTNVPRVDAAATGRGK